MLVFKPTGWPPQPFSQVINNARDRYKSRFDHTDWPRDNSAHDAHWVCPARRSARSAGQCHRFFDRRPAAAFWCHRFGRLMPVGHGLRAHRSGAKLKRVWRGGWVLNLLPLPLPVGSSCRGASSVAAAHSSSLGKNKQANNRARGRAINALQRPALPHSYRPSRCPRMTPHEALRQQRTQIPSPEPLTQAEAATLSTPTRKPKEN